MRKHKRYASFARAALAWAIANNRLPSRDTPAASQADANSVDKLCDCCSRATLPSAQADANAGDNPCATSSIHVDI